MKKLLIVASVVAVGFGVAKWRAAGHGSAGSPGSQDAQDDKPLVMDRLWIDHIPRSEREPVNLFLLFQQQKFGAFHVATAWRGGYERFRFKKEGGTLRAEFPQTGQREDITVKARPCNDQRGLDFCLELDGNSRGVKRYYSKKGWEIRSLDDAERIEQQIENGAPE